LVQILAGAPFRPIRLSAAIAAAIAGYASQARFSSAGVAEAVGAFLAGRMASWQKGYDMRYDLVDAVLARPFDRPFDTLRWIVALSEAARAPHFEALVTCVKRASRILPPEFSGEVDPARLTDDAEVALHAAIQKTEAQVGTLGQDGLSCDAVLQALSSLAEPLGCFFDGVLVMAPDAAVRQNRLGLCLRVRRLFDRVADFSKIEGGGPAALTPV
jgi:glycyl-tRNA synthetase beta chain